MYIQALKYKGGRSSSQYRIYIRDTQLKRKLRVRGTPALTKAEK